MATSRRTHPRNQTPCRKRSAPHPAACSVLHPAMGRHTRVPPQAHANPSRSPMAVPAAASTRPVGPSCQLPRGPVLQHLPCFASRAAPALHLCALFWDGDIRAPTATSLLTHPCLPRSHDDLGWPRPCRRGPDPPGPYLSASLLPGEASAVCGGARQPAPAAGPLPAGALHHPSDTPGATLHMYLCSWKMTFLSHNASRQICAWTELLNNQMQN